MQMFGSEEQIESERVKDGKRALQHPLETRVIEHWVVHTRFRFCFYSIKHPRCAVAITAHVLSKSEFICNSCTIIALLLQAQAAKTE